MNKSLVLPSFDVSTTSFGLRNAKQRHQVQTLQLKLNFSHSSLVYEYHKSEQQLTLHINHRFLLLHQHKHAICITPHPLPSLAIYWKILFRNLIKILVLHLIIALM